MKVRAGSYEYLMVGLSWYDLGRDKDWFENILKENRENPTIIVAHNIVDCSDTEPSSVQFSGVGDEIWNIIKKYDQVFMTVSGHYHGAGNKAVSYTHLTLPTIAAECRSRWSPYH